MAAVHFNDQTNKDVLRQVEFYFSDSNLPRDKFLTDAVSESEDGLVSLALICSFGRMRYHLRLGSVTVDEIPEVAVLAVAEVLKKSTLLKISDDGKKVGRLTALLKPEEVIEQVDSRTIAASPLEYDVVMGDVQTYFSQYGKINSVRLPRHVADSRSFSGTALVEFSTEEDAKNILGQHLVYAGAELELKPKKEYDSEREKLMNQVRSSQDSNKKEDSSMNDWYPKGLIVTFQLKTLTSKTDKNNGACHQNGGDVAHQEHVAPTSADEDNVNADNSLEDGCIVDAVNLSKQEETEFAGVENLENGDKNSAGNAVARTQKGDAIMREDLKEVFQKFGTVQFVDYRMGEESGYIRFEVPEAGQKARALADMADEGGLTVKGRLVTLEPVTGDAEKQYWKLLRSNQDRNKSFHGRGGRHNNRGRHSNGKRNRDKISYTLEGRPDKARKART